MESKSSLRYWFDGDGQWMNRWCCTGHDSLLFWVMSSLTIAMFGLYVYYAMQSHFATRSVKECHFVSHLKSLRNVFLLCGLIHVINSVLSWWIPIYYSICVLMVVNIWQCVNLVLRKSEIIAIQKHIEGEHAVQVVENALDMIAAHQRKGQADGISEALAKLEIVLRRERSA